MHMGTLFDVAAAARQPHQSRDFASDKKKLAAGRGTLAAKSKLSYSWLPRCHRGPMFSGRVTQ